MSKKWTLVTGASSDIGLETVKILLQEKEFVWCIHRGKSRNLNELKKQYSNNLHISKYDFLEQSELESYIDEIKERKHQIKSFISLASLRRNVEYGEISIADLNDHFFVNTIPSVLAVQELGEAMSEQGYGRIVIGSSIGVKFGGGIKSYCYSLTKFASELLPQISKSWVASNVLSNIVRIGVTDTTSMQNENLVQRCNLIPIKRPATPFEIATFLAWLGSNKNTYISNQLIPISGGE